MNKINTFAFVVAIVFTNSTGFCQTSSGFEASSNALANKMRSQSYSRLANMGVDMPPRPQHSLNFQSTETAGPYQHIPAANYSMPTESKTAKSTFRVWNPLSWFSWEARSNTNDTQRTQQELGSNSTSRAYASSSSVAGSASVRAAGNGSRSLAVSNANGLISIESSMLVNGKVQKFQLRGSETEIRNQLNQLPIEVKLQILEALGN
jgi:hypothetical protein